MDCPDRQVVLISGAPAAGKTSLAAPLAAELGFTLLGKDRIKEALYDALEGPEAHGAGPEWSTRLGAAAMELLWALAADAPSVVLEANFRPRHEYQRGLISGLGGRVVEVNCSCPPEVAVRRFAERATNSRHPVHAIVSLTPEDLAEYDGPVGIGELISVDTTAAVDVRVLAREVRARLGVPV
jgi:predicted kinase